LRVTKLSQKTIYIGLSGEIDVKDHLTGIVRWRTELEFWIDNWMLQILNQGDFHELLPRDK
jgi:hypothetical protein